jgi:AcrR family transcriptional regulator
VTDRVERTRSRVLDATRQLVEEGGPAAVTYSALAERSGVGRATLYRHWPNLEDLWHEMGQAMALQFGASLSGDMEADLRRAMAEMVVLIRRQPERVSLVTLLERAQWDPVIRANISRVEKVTPVRQALDLAVRNGQLPGHVDLDVAASQLLGPLLYRELMTGDEPDEAFAAVIVEDFLDRLRGGAFPHPAPRRPVAGPG